MASPTWWTWVWVNSSWWWTGRPGCWDSWGHKELDTTEWLNWTELNWKKAESQRTDAFKLWYWRRLLRVPWTARRSNQSILKEVKCKLLSHDPMDYTVHGILQVRILEWVAIPFSRGSSQCRDQIQVFHIVAASLLLSHQGVISQEINPQYSLGDDEGQGGLACCSPWSCKELEMTGWPNNISLLADPLQIKIICIDTSRFKKITFHETWEDNGHVVAVVQF